MPRRCVIRSEFRSPAPNPALNEFPNFKALLLSKTIRHPSSSVFERKRIRRLQKPHVTWSLLTGAKLYPCFGLKHFNKVHLLHHTQASLYQLATNQEFAGTIRQIGMETFWYVFSINIACVYDQMIKPRHFH